MKTSYYNYKEINKKLGLYYCSLSQRYIKKDKQITFYEKFVYMVYKDESIIVFNQMIRKHVYGYVILGYC